MADHKLQHYVPRCHLKPFSYNAEGKCINLLQIDKLRPISRASVRTQCAESYFYGDDLAIEKSLQAPEGAYASIIKKLVDGNSLSLEELNFLKSFAYLQHLRTDTSAKRQMAATIDIAETIFEGKPPASIASPPSKREIIRHSIKLFLDTMHYLNDIKSIVVCNQSNVDFVTSDDPATTFNRLYTQRFGSSKGQSGIANAGLLLAMPLTPKHLLLCYDTDTYTCQDLSAGSTTTKSTSDIDALNQIQYIKASNVIYFADWESSERIIFAYNSIKNMRPDSWHKIHYAILDEASSNEAKKIYRKITRPEDKFAAAESLIHIESMLPTPTKWFSKLRFRTTPRYIDTGNATGLLRRATIDL